MNMESPQTSTPVDLAAELQRIYDSELNIEISWLWDGGIDLRLGDRMNGFLAEENCSGANSAVRSHYREDVPLRSDRSSVQGPPF